MLETLKSAFYFVVLLRLFHTHFMSCSSAFPLITQTLLFAFIFQFFSSFLLVCLAALRFPTTVDFACVRLTLLIDVRARMTTMSLKLAKKYNTFSHLFQLFIRFPRAFNVTSLKSEWRKDEKVANTRQTTSKGNWQLAHGDNGSFSPLFANNFQLISRLEVSNVWKWTRIVFNCRCEKENRCLLLLNSNFWLKHFFFLLYT